MDKRRSYQSRKMGKKKESKEKPQRGFSSRRSSSLEQADTHHDPAGSIVISHDDDSPLGQYPSNLTAGCTGCCG